ncbi:DEAD/DEAH box helicase [Candidatus Pacearchaeota archaeon]|nr:DEAD/DEAH box helicase [Candidatus Pacearchaeota archaeon]
MDFSKSLKGITPREYQHKIFETCSKKNCLVVLPTGLGKTLIAVMLAMKRLEEFPFEKVLILAPTRPLVEQHYNSFKKYLPELFAELQMFTGQIPATQRKKIWQNSDIVFSTPQCVANDLKNKLYDLSDVSLLVEDEAHRCVKNYDYNYISSMYQKSAQNPRIIGLTASPGNDTKKIREICRNLHIEEVELRNRESPDVEKYIQELEFEKIKVDFPPEFVELKHILRKLLNYYIEELKNRKVLYGIGTKKDLLEVQKKISGMIARATGGAKFNYLSAASASAQAIKIQHAIELLETQTLFGFSNYLKNLFNQAAKNQSKGVQRLVAKPEFNYVYTRTQELIAKNIEHPKIKKLKEFVENEISKNPKTKIIVFTQYRDTAQIISQKLNKIKNINSKVFVGQAKKISTHEKGKEDLITGMNQKQQRQIIEEFSEGKINVLSATSLHPEEYIILKNNDKIMIKTIGEFVDSFLKRNKDSSREIRGWQTLSSNGKNLIFKPITQIHKHQAKDNVVKVNLKSGFDCLITKDHELFSFNKKDNFVPSTPKINKFVALCLSTPNIKIKNQIDVLDEISKNCEDKSIFGTVHGLNQNKIRILKTHTQILNQIKKTEKSIAEISKKTEKDYSTIMHNLQELKKNNFICQRRERKNFKNLSKITYRGKQYLDFLNWLSANMKYNKKKYKFSLKKTIPKEYNKFFEQKFNINYGKINFPRFIELNKYLARFLGFYVSEGHVRKTKFTSGIFLAARKKEMRELMKKSIENGLHLKTRTNWRGVAIDSQISYYLIKDVFKAGIGAYNKEVPETIFTAPTNIKWEFLKAYFLGDGHLGKDKIVLTTVSRKLVVGLMFLLRSLGIEKISLYKQKQIYRLNIFESLPFAKIKEKNNKRRKAYFSLIPRALQNKEYYTKAKNYFNKVDYKSPRIIGKWENNICFDYIKKITKIKKPNFVYDITVEGTKNFTGGTGLFCLHNCIAEEGLDIPEVNLVIFYEPIPSAIRAIQRAGRTARLMKGKLIMLITKNTRDETFYYVSRGRQKKMKTAIESVKRDLKNNKKFDFQKRL